METEIVDNKEISVPGKTETKIFEPSQSFTNSEKTIVSGFKKEIIEFLIRLNIAKIVVKSYKNPLLWIKILKSLDQFRRTILGKSRIKKLTKVDGKYYWDLYIPGWPSKAFNKFIEAEINRIEPVKIKTNRFTNIFIAITKKCPLQCEHCFEWDALNKKEKLTLPDLQNIVQKFQEFGTGQFQITGGEPMLRVNDIHEILLNSKKDSEFWVLTSGFNFTIENAQKLKKAGLTGVVISLDHFDPEFHNLFRGFKNSYEWVEKSVINAKAVNLVTALSICVSRSFVTESNLLIYNELAKKMGVSFVQILEPKAVGHYKGKDVALQPEHGKILDEFYFKLNYQEKFKEYPIISYHGYHQRQIGCFAVGNRNLYIDTDGDLHACPFCQSKMGSALSENINNTINQLQLRGCQSFKSAAF
ncbi:hypothetical protein BH23BAC1_BH23BAC1_31530 [soil metagenome]